MATMTRAEYSALTSYGLAQLMRSEGKAHPVRWKVYLNQISASDLEWTHDGRVFTALGAMPEKAPGTVFTVDKPILSTEKTSDVIPYGLAVILEHELEKYEKYGAFKKLGKSLSAAGIYTKNVLGYSPLNAAFSTSDSNLTTHKSEALCKTNHTLLRATSVVGKNHPTTASALSWLAMQEMFNDFGELVNEDGLFQMLEASVLIVQTQNRWVAETLLQSQYRPDNPNHAKNTVAGHGLTIHDTPFITTAANWFVTSEKSGVWGESVQFHLTEELNMAMDYQASTRNHLMTMYMACRVWVLEWMGIWGSPGS